MYINSGEGLGQNTSSQAQVPQHNTITSVQCTFKWYIHSKTPLIRIPGVKINK